MTLGQNERSVRDRIGSFADTLAVDIEGDWQRTQQRAASQRDEHVVSRRRRRRRVRPVLLGSVLAAIAAAGTVGVLTLGAAGSAIGALARPEPLPFTHGSHTAAVHLLDHAARSQDASPAGTGPVRYARTQSYALQTNVGAHSSTTYVETTIRDVWVKPNGTGVAKTMLQDTTRDGVSVGTPQNLSTDNHWQDDNPSLPTAPATLRADLLGSNANDGEQSDLILAQQITSDLAEGTSTPTQTASLYRLLATMPGVFDAGTVIDSTGRTGHAIGIQTGYFDSGHDCVQTTGPYESQIKTLGAHDALGRGITYLVLDPTTGQPLLVELIFSPNPPCGLKLPAVPTIQQYSLILKAGVVASVGQRVSWESYSRAGWIVERGQDSCAPRPTATTDPDGTRRER
jgi:hypothetical protein